MADHAPLSPSSASRWLSCPASVTLSAGADDEESEYAGEGTAAHELAEIEAAMFFKLIKPSVYDERRESWDERYLNVYDTDEMDEHVEDYISFLDGIVQDAGGAASVLLEQRMSAGIKGCWGTSDAVIITADTIHVVDLKYGRGIAVEVEHNAQIMLYALGALDEFGDLLDDTRTVKMSIFQPRNGGASTWETSPAELRGWREAIRPVAAIALSGENAWFGPSESACRWCPMSGTCKAQLTEVFGGGWDETDPATMTPEEQGAMLDRVAFIKNWLVAFEAAALHSAYHEETAIPGYKVVLSSGRRSYTDPEAVVDALKAAERGDLVKIAPEALTKVEKALGKGEFTKLLGGLVQRSDGKPSLVPEDDGREAISSTEQARRDFEEAAE